MLWYPESDVHLTEQRGRGSRKKQSEHRLNYDLGCRPLAPLEASAATTQPSRAQGAQGGGASARAGSDGGSIHLRAETVLRASEKEHAEGKRALELAARAAASSSDAYLTESVRAGVQG
jgi:hypothetical protein